ncbi:MAG: monovalent cation/H(+) antiporter subunit G [Treponema sp.]|nr:monovalent cation/H(+) antiporter subunit G [Treponema sp.]
MEIIRFLVAAVFILFGLFVLGVATVGLYRLKYVLNRIHASAKCDTLGSLLVLVGVCILLGFTFTTLKLALLIVFIWLTNPVAVHMIGRAEILTNSRLEDEVEVVER